MTYPVVDISLLNLYCIMSAVILNSKIKDGYPHLIEIICQTPCDLKMVIFIL